MPQSSRGHCALWILLSLLPGASLTAQLGDRGGELQRPIGLEAPPSPALPPPDALKTMQLDPELRLQLVCAEPIVQDPIALSFDEDGRFWVVEMRGFMSDLDGQNETAPSGRIRILEDTDGDGRVDRGVTFLDQLVSPRAVAPTHGGALVADATRLFFARDINGDLRADQIVLVDGDYGLRRNVEHEANGLFRSIDNWFYSANSKARYAFRQGRWIKEASEFRGQWGLSQDDYGRLFYNVNYSQLHGDLVPSILNRNPHHLARHGLNLLIATNQQVYPARMNTGVNRGYRPGILDERGRLRAFTSASAPLVYRGDHLPPEYRNNAFVCEPAANLLKRNLLSGDGLNLRAEPAYPDREFLASTDERFRPVWLATGLDGALYIVDMYRGVLQHKEYMTSYLRREVLARQLDQPIHWGRIYRVVRFDTEPSQPARLSHLSSAELVHLLNHPNGPSRDAVQRLLVERADQAVVPDLIRLVRHATDPRAKVHALWTLEGLACNDTPTWLSALEDPEPQVRIAALRVLQSLSPRTAREAKSYVQPLRRLTRSGPEEAQVHAVLAAGTLPPNLRLPLLSETVNQYASNPLFRDAVLSGLEDQELAFLKRLMRGSDRSVYQPGWDALFQALGAAVVRSRNAADVLQLLEIISKEKTGWRFTALTAGIAQVARQSKPIALARRPKAAESSSNKTRSETKVSVTAELAQALFSWPGHEPAGATALRPLNVEEKRWFGLGREQFVSVCAACHGVDGQGLPSLGPPLANSNWVLGSPETLIRVVLHGLEGPVEVTGVRYAPPLSLPDMPSFSALSDESIAAILTYIRRAWDHGAEPVPPSTVTEVRRVTLDRQVPYTTEELMP